MKISKMIAMVLSVVMASQMMVPMAFGAETEANEVVAMEGLHLMDATEDVSGGGYTFDYEADGSTFTVTDDVVIQDTFGIILPANATLLVEADASLTIYAETYGIYADGDMDLVLDGDLSIVVGMEGATMEDPLYAIVAAGTYDADGNYKGDGNLNITSTGNVEMVARDGIYSSGDMNILGGTWNMMAYVVLSSNTNDVTVEDGIWNIVANSGIAVYGGNATIVNCEFYANAIYSISAAEGIMTIGDGCVVMSDGCFVGKDIVISENSDINGIIGYCTEDGSLEERPWTVMICGDVVFTHMAAESGFYNDHIVFAEGATLTIAEEAMFSLAPTEGREGDTGSTMDTTGGTVTNHGVMIFNAGTTEEEIDAMHIQGNGAVGVMNAVEDRYSVPFIDVSTSNWFHDSVYLVTTFDLMEGISEVEFAPTATATYEMFLGAMYALSGENTLPAYAGVSAVDWAVERGILEEVTPDAPITREQMIAILYFCVGSPIAEGDLSQFVDGETISEDAKDAMIWAVAESLIVGHPDGTLDATGGATRAQIANLLFRLIQNMMAQ
ncbi:S-layer homology domain-containing protein [Chakrabartyella piscis]|uniref:S-layer homology domain-containing protein n=1 Tax=Chakrabartyella piscis TaxID=2918914 RepID=UPI00295866DE|nr:S-layer homology domain-containing protein [Chakrabartyella piscis]